MVLNFNEYIAESENRRNGEKSLYEVITGFKELGYAFYGFMHPYKNNAYSRYWDGPYLDHSDFTINKNSSDAYNEFFFEDNKDIHYIPSDFFSPQNHLVFRRDDAYSESYDEHYSDNIIPKDGIKYYVFWCKELKYFYIIKDTNENHELVKKLIKERPNLSKIHRENIEIRKEAIRRREESDRRYEKMDELHTLYKTNPDAFKDITNDKKLRNEINELIHDSKIPYYDVEMNINMDGSESYMRITEFEGVKYKYEFRVKGRFSSD